MKILIIGLGSIGKKHVDALIEINKSIIIYAFRSNKNSKKYKTVINIYKIEEIESLNLDLIIISNPTSFHKNVLEELKFLKIPVFIEKPLYHNLNISELVNYYEFNNIFSYMGCNLRFLDSLVYLKDKVLLNDEKINEINVYCGSYLPSWRKVNFRNTYSTKPELGGGVHLDSIHEIDYIYWLFGYPAKVNSILKNKSSLKIKSADYANYSLDYGNFCVNIVMNYFRKFTKRNLEILTKDNIYEIDLINNTIFKNGIKMFNSKQKIIDTYKTQMQYVINCVNNNLKSFNTIKDGYNVLKICLNESS